MKLSGKLATSLADLLVGKVEQIRETFSVHTVIETNSGFRLFCR